MIYPVDLERQPADAEFQFFVGLVIRRRRFEADIVQRQLPLLVIGSAVVVAAKRHHAGTRVPARRHIVDEGNVAVDGLVAIFGFRSPDNHQGVGIVVISVVNPGIGDRQIVCTARRGQETDVMPVPAQGIAFEDLIDAEPFLDGVALAGEGLVVTGGKAVIERGFARVVVDG